MNTKITKTSFRHVAIVASFGTVVALVGCASGPTEDEVDATGLGEDQIVAGAYKCDGTEDVNQKGLGKGSGSLKAVRAAAHPEAGFDRFVMEFEAHTSPDAYIVQRKPGTTFTGTGEGPGAKTKVEGEDGIAVIFLNGVMGSTFSGPRRLAFADAKAIKEAAQYEQFEGNIEWGLGTQKNPCFRTSTLLNPPRLIVDVKR